MFVVSHKQCPILFQNRKQGHMTRCHKDANVTKTSATHMLEPKHNCMICTSFGMWSIGSMGNNLNHTLKDLPLPPPPPQWAAGDNASSSTFFAYGLLALPSLTHTLKDLPLSL